MWSHDRPFFDKVVRPYLAHKKEKQFVDHWLLEDDLSEFTQLWKYNQLNAAERALLSMRLPESRESIRRELREIVAEQEIDHNALRMQIGQALATGGLSVRGQVMLSDGVVAMENAEMLGEMVLADEEMDNFSFGVPMRGRGGSVRGKISRRFEQDEAKKNQAKKSKAIYGGRAAGGGMGGGAYGFYQELDSTKQWAESHWDRVRTVSGPDPSSLIAVNPFWSDLANGDLGNTQLSTHMLRPADNRHSILLALAFCGLPLEAGEIGLPTETDKPYAPQHPVAIVTKRLQVLEQIEQASEILVGQRFAAIQQRNDDDQQEPTEFLTGVGYQGQTVISNPTSERKIVDVFWQIPAGSVPIGGSQDTDSRTITLEPFAVQAIEYKFYFPSAGQFVHYPATIASDGKLLARGGEKTFAVVEQPTENDEVTWENVAQSGTADQIKSFLADANLHDIDWMLVAHRMQDQDVYRVVVDVLGDAKLPICLLYTSDAADE